LFDILTTILMIPGEVRFVAKKEILKLPVLGFILHKSENIVIDREGGGKAIRRAIEVVRHGYSICVFAEGHRYSDNRVHEFSDGAAWLAILNKLPCVPMAISGTSTIMPRGAKFVVPGRHIRMKIGAPIATAGMKSGAPPSRPKFRGEGESSWRAIIAAPGIRLETGRNISPWIARPEEQSLRELQARSTK
jgi:1-acyl-sn-glycerol-3-phosphate acyltransferase